MIFEIEHSVERENRVLKYITEEYSFDTEPPAQEMVYEFVLNDTGSIDTYNTLGYLEHEAVQNADRSFNERSWEQLNEKFFNH